MLEKLQAMIQQAQHEFRLVADSDDKELWAFYRGRLVALEELYHSLKEE